MNDMFSNSLAQAGMTTDPLTDNVQQTTDAVWNSFHDFWRPIANTAPKLFCAALVMIAGYVIARLVSKAITAIADRLGLQRMAENAGFVQSMQHVGIHRTVPQVLGTIFFWLLLCVFLIASVDILDLPTIKIALDRLLNYVPNLLVASIVVVLGLLLAAFLRGVVATSADRVGIHYAQQLASACYWILALMTFNAALNQLEIQIKLFNEIVLILLAGGALAFGLSFGLGGREVMAGILAGYYLRQRLQAGLGRNSPADLFRSDAWIRVHEHEGEHLPLRGRERDRLAVAGVADREALERAAGLHDAHDDGPVVVHLEDAAEPEGLARPDPLVAGVVHDHRVGLPQVGDRAEEHLCGRADERGVVEPEEDHLLVRALLEPRPAEALVEPHRPGHPRHALDAEEFRVGQRLDVVDELHVGVHDPDVGPLDVADLAHRQ